jgi:hypothetical protein
VLGYGIHHRLLNGPQGILEIMAEAPPPPPGASFSLFDQIMELIFEGDDDE